jgi:hypothetical protein
MTHLVLAATKNCLLYDFCTAIQNERDDQVSKAKMGIEKHLIFTDLKRVSIQEFQNDFAVAPDFQKLVEEAANFTSDYLPKKPFLTSIKIDVPIPPQVAA